MLKGKQIYFPHGCSVKDAQANHRAANTQEWHCRGKPRFEQEEPDAIKLKTHAPLSDDIGKIDVDVDVSAANKDRLLHI